MMEKLIFDVMLDERYICTLRMAYCPLFPLEMAEIRAFVVKKRPTLRNKEFVIAL